MMAPPYAVNEAGATTTEAEEYLAHNEWEVALDILSELEGWTASPAWWDLLIEAAQLMQLAHTLDWCRWRRWESTNGIIRAELRLLPTSDGGRQTPMPGNGVLRPLWHIGQYTATGEPSLRVARVWVEYAQPLGPGETATVRLAPLTPAGWRDLQPGQTITMHERMPVVGIAAIAETSAGSAAPAPR